MRLRRALAPPAISAVALVLAACGGGTPAGGRTVTFPGNGAFPPTTIVGRYSTRGCTFDAGALVRDSRLYYAHSVGGAPAPADLYYFELRLAYAHFYADECTSEGLGRALRRGLTARQRSFLLANLASDLLRPFRKALEGA